MALSLRIQNVIGNGATFQLALQDAQMKAEAFFATKPTGAFDPSFQPQFNVRQISTPGEPPVWEAGASFYYTG